MEINFCFLTFHETRYNRSCVNTLGDGFDIYNIQLVMDSNEAVSNVSNVIM